MIANLFSYRVDLGLCAPRQSIPEHHQRSELIMKTVALKGLVSSPSWSGLMEGKMPKPSSISKKLPIKLLDVGDRILL